MNALGKFNGHCHSPEYVVYSQTLDTSMRRGPSWDGHPILDCVLTCESIVKLPGGTKTLASGNLREKGPANTLCSMP
eukprot:8331331-Ditylum_brightwellii.AAC.1